MIFWISVLSCAKGFSWENVKWSSSNEGLQKLGQNFVFDGVKEKAVIASLKEEIILYHRQAKQFMLSEPF